MLLSFNFIPVLIFAWFGLSAFFGWPLPWDTMFWVFILFQFLPLWFVLGVLSTWSYNLYRERCW